MKTAAYHIEHNWGAQKGDKIISHNLFVCYVNTIIALEDNIKINCKSKFFYPNSIICSIAK